MRNVSRFGEVTNRLSGRFRSSSGNGMKLCQMFDDDGESVDLPQCLMKFPAEKQDIRILHYSDALEPI